MGLVSRRKFASMVGLFTAGGILKTVHAQTHGAEHAAPPKPQAPQALQPKPAESAKPASSPAAANTSKPARPSVDRAVASLPGIWRDLMEGNKRFVAGQIAAKVVIKARARTAAAQHPYVFVLCCSD